MGQNETTWGPLVLVLCSIYQGKPFWGCPIFDPQPCDSHAVYAVRADWPLDSHEALGPQALETMRRVLKSELEAIRWRSSFDRNERCLGPRFLDLSPQNEGPDPNNLLFSKGSILIIAKTNRGMLIRSGRHQLVRCLKSAKSQVFVEFGLDGTRCDRCLSSITGRTTLFADFGFAIGHTHSCFSLCILL